MPNQPNQTAKNEPGDFERFTGFMKRLVAVPHAEIKERIKETKRTRTLKTSSRVAASSPKRAS